MKEKLKEIETLLKVTREKISELYNDDFEQHHLRDELFSQVASAMMTAKDFDKYDSTRKDSNEILYLKTSYKLMNSEMCICFNDVYNINALSHNYHIYELTSTRILEYRDDEEYTNIDNVHKILVLCDFDFNNCMHTEYKESFTEELFLHLADLRYDNIDISFKQLS